MKLILLTAFLTLQLSASAEDTTWVRKHINDVLTLELPEKAEPMQEEGKKGYLSNINNEIFLGISYADTVVPTKNFADFKFRLKQFGDGVVNRFSEQFEGTLLDTTVARTKGILITLTSKGNDAFARRVFYYVTIANGVLYSFIATNLTNVKLSKIESRFLDGIKFDIDKVKEARYVSSS